ncbi:MAG: phosphate propanoyltransferase [Bacillus sp. (in: Bacteria)]|nr:phosphate propanoyltransferase [Bacillus sp. (in: firmicutes)]
MEETRLRKLIEEMVRTTLSEKAARNNATLLQDEVPIAVSNRHVHLSPAALERLFGRGYKLTKLKDLSQPGQFAAKETVTLFGPKGKLANVRILGPARGETQVEISLSDGFTLGVHPPVRFSGDITGTPGIKIQGPRGQLTIKEGLICAARHIHMHPDDAEAFGVEDGELVKIKVDGPRSVIFAETLIRVSPKYRLEMHVDFDEANAAHLQKGQTGKLMRQELK